MKNEKGITLIALVITIIVMLILVTVTIRVATDGNLFTHAANAVKGTKTAIAGENDILNDNLDKSIEEIVAEQTGNITYTAYEVGDTITISEQNFYVIEDSNEHTSTVKLLLESNVESVGIVAFDTAGSTDYANSSIKTLVNTYVASLSITGAQGRLMLKDEAEALLEEHEGILTGYNYWLGTPDENFPDRVYVVDGIKGADIHSSGAELVDNYGLRPLIIVPKANIPAQD